MINRIHGKIVFECDSCGEYLDTDESDFQNALQELRDASWKSIKIGQDWSHSCEACNEDA